jgi:galactokinase
MVDPRGVVQRFRERFDESDDLCVFRAPGRVNLIGEHTDYNDGFVMPIAIDRDTVIACRARKDGRIRIYSTNLDELAEFSIGDTDVPKWARYILGVASVLARSGASLSGMDAVVESDVPVGAGLSSSAALEISSGYAMLRVSHQPLDKLTLALAGQRAEHEFVGTKCGIMDQYVSALGVHDAALLIDCRTLQSTTIPIDTTETAIVICDSRVKHDLADTAYNERRRECEEAVRILKDAMPGISALRDVSVAEFHEHERLLPQPIRRRARHVVTENERTLLAADALRGNRFHEMGELMYASHASLREDYEVTVPELDVLVDATLKIPGVYGSRMTGGGFGGCTVSLMRREALREFEDRMAEAYRAAFAKELIIYSTGIVNGVEEVVL